MIPRPQAFTLPELIGFRSDAFRAKDDAGYARLSEQVAEALQASEMIEIVPDAKIEEAGDAGIRREPLSKWLAYLAHPKPETDQVLHRSAETIKAQIESGTFRCFALAHPELPNELVAVAYGAPKDKICTNYGEAFSAPAYTHHARAVTLCSIVVPNTGLLSLGLPQNLLKRILTEVVPQNWDAATLSPMPGFRSWLDKLLSQPENAGQVGEMLRSWGAGGTEILNLRKAAGEENICTAAAKLLREWAGPKDAPNLPPGPVPEAVQMPLKRLALVYLRGKKTEVGKDGKIHSLDPVYDMHVGERDATLAGLHTMADPSPNGMAWSYGTLVNYWSRGKPPIEPAHSRW